MNYHHHHHHIHFRVLFSSTAGWAFRQVFLEGVLSTQNDSDGQQNPYLASFCHSQALHPMISFACQIFSVQPHSACVLLQSSLCCALHVQTISSYWCGALRKVIDSNTCTWKNLFMPYANNKGADQSAHMRSLISTFVVCCLDSIIPLLAIAKLSRL